MLEHEKNDTENIGRDNIGKNNLNVFFKEKHRRYENNINDMEEFAIICYEDGENRMVLEPSGGHECMAIAAAF